MGGPSHHEPLRAMGPVAWRDIPQDNIKEFLADIFADTQTVIESIPAVAKLTPLDLASGRARASTESALSPVDVQRQPPAQRQKALSMSQAQELRKEWKEIKVNARENPLGINVHKLSAKDGRGAWFSRRSVHDGLSFDDWKRGLEIEFAETMKIQGSPGSGNIRGIGADKRVEDRPIDGFGELQVFQLSAQFPGPTAPRDFVTLLLTSETSMPSSDGARPLRQFMVVSKPCEHPECPPRQGIIRGYYESVEVIREVPVDTTADRKSLSMTNLSAETTSTTQASSAVEWIMVTRSDPGGSVPRFLIEKGTPPGIIGDAGKFVKWVTSQAAHGFSEPIKSDVAPEDSQVEPGNNQVRVYAPVSTAKVSSPSAPAVGESLHPMDDVVPSSSGLYSIISGAISAATYLVPTGLLKQIAGYPETTPSENGSTGAQSTKDKGQEEDGEDDSSVSDASSIRSFASALEGDVTENKFPDSTTETQSETSKSNAPAALDREYKKLQERRRKLDEKLGKMQRRRDDKLQGDKVKDAATLAKLHEKHEREVARQEDKYRREMRKIEEKREQEERKAEARRRKAQEREEKKNMALELDRIRAERDLARKEGELLEAQVRELQAQNTALARKLGQVGVLNRSESTPALQSPSAATKSPTATELPT